MYATTCERTFLVNCLRARWAPGALEEARAVGARAGFDWELMLDLARSQGVSALLYAAVRGQDLVPEEIEATLRADYFGNARRNLLLFKELEAVLQRLDEAGVEVILLKGVALAEGVYGNPAVRPMTDLDLLVREEDVGKALELLSALGYETHHPDLHPRDLLLHTNELMLQKTGTINTLIEVHWRIFWFEYYRDVLMVVNLFERSQTFNLGTTTALMLGPEDLILHLCGHLLHHYEDEEAFPLIWLYDVAVVLHYYASDIDWEQVFERALDSRLVMALQRVMWQVSKELQAPVSPVVVERLQNLKPSTKEVRAVRWLGDVTRSMDHYALGTLMSLPDWPTRVSYLWSKLLFPAPGFMRCRYNIPNSWLIPLYYPYRWLLGVWELLGSVVSGER